MHFPPGWRKTDKRPAIVFFFGGGWRAGSTRQFLKQAGYLASRGMVTARADYRVRSRHQTGPEKCVEDAKSAVRWLRAKASELGVDPERIVASGGSAGGHIAACSLLTKGLDSESEDGAVSSKPNALVLFNPVLDLSGLGRNVTGPEGEDLTERISPTLQLAADLPPTILFYGTRDRFTPQGREFTRRSRELENRVELYTASGQPHGFFNRSPWMELTLRRADEFLVSLGYLEGPPTVEVPDVPEEPELTKE